jgi:hypothetical protein
MSTLKTFREEMTITVYKEGNLIAVSKVTSAEQ